MSDTKLEPPAVIIYLRNGRVMSIVADGPVRVRVAEWVGPGPGVRPYHPEVVRLPGWGACRVGEVPVMVDERRVEVVGVLVGQAHQSCIDAHHAAADAEMTGTTPACSRL